MGRRRGVAYVAAAVVVIIGIGAWVGVSVEHSAGPAVPIGGAGGSSDEPEAQRPIAVFIGDSYTQGTGSSGAGFVTVVAGRRGWEAVNLGRGGTGYHKELSDTEMARKGCGMAQCPPYAGVLAAASQLDPDVVVVSGGRNDVGSDPAALAVAIREFFVDVREAAPRARIYAISPIWDDEPAPVELERISAEVRESVRAVAGSYFDIGHPLSGRPGLMSKDGVHPNDKGYAAIAEAILEALPAS